VIHEMDEYFIVRQLNEMLEIDIVNFLKKQSLFYRFLSFLL